MPDHLSGEQRARLLSCLDAVRDVVGETVSDHAIVRAVLKHNYDCAAALDAILSDAMAGMPGGGPGGAGAATGAGGRYGGTGALRC